MPIFNFKTTDYKKKREGVFVKSITGTHSQLCVIRLEHGESTMHVHEQEQIGLILKGEVELTIGNETRIVSENMGFYIPSNVVHGFRVCCPEGLEYIEVFCPPKETNRM